MSFGAPYFVGLRYCRGEQRKACGRGRCDGVGECAVLQWVPGGRKRALACLSETGSRGQLWLGLPLARQKVLLRDGEGSAVRWLVQRVALGGAACCDGWCSVLRWAVQRAAMAGAACCVCRASAQAGSALCGELREGMPWSRAARVPSLSGKPGFLSVASSCIVLCAMLFNPPCGCFMVRKPHFAFPIALLCTRFAARKRKLLYLCDRMRTHVHTHTQ